MVDYFSVNEVEEDPTLDILALKRFRSAEDHLEQNKN